MISNLFFWLNDTTLAQIGGYSVVVPFIAGIILYKHLALPFRLYLGILMMSLIVDFLSFWKYLYSSTGDQNTLDYVYIFYLVQIIIFYFIVKHIDFSNNTIKRIILNGIMILWPLVGIILLYKYDYDSYAGPALALTNLAFISCTLLYFWDFTFYKELGEENFSTIFYFMAGLLIYNNTLIVMNYSYEYLNTEFYNYLYRYKHFTYIMFNIFLAYILIKEKSTSYVS